MNPSDYYTHAYDGVTGKIMAVSDSPMDLLEMDLMHPRVITTGILTSNVPWMGTISMAIASTLTPEETEKLLMKICVNPSVSVTGIPHV